MKVWSLQSLRFFAALAVVIFHAESLAFAKTGQAGLLGTNQVRLGQIGVDIFFVLSGLIIALTSKGLSPGAFAAKRATRILPLYLMMTALYFVARLPAGPVGWREVVTSLTLWPALDQMTNPIVGVAWTLCFEALFYAAATLVLWRPKMVWLLAAVFLAALGLQADPVTRFVGNPLILEFLAGVGLAFLPPMRGAVLLLPIGLVLAWFLGPAGYQTTVGGLYGDHCWERVLYFGVPAAMIVWGAWQLKTREGVLSYLGETSYALYLVHPSLLVAVFWLLVRIPGLAPDAMVAIAAAVSVVVAWRVHEVVEKPVLRWLRRRPPQPAFA